MSFGVDLKNTKIAKMAVVIRKNINKHLPMIIYATIWTKTKILRDLEK
jgi:hypothetical protein